MIKISLILWFVDLSINSKISTEKGIFFYLIIIKSLKKYSF